jgi:hypothetical protein
MCGIFSFGKYLAIHWGQTCSAVSGLPPQKMQARALRSESMADNEQQPTPKTQPTQPNQRDALSEAKRLMAEAEAHERRVAIREESARFLDERGETEGAEHERREADLERDAARNAWDRAQALQGPMQFTDKGLEIPIPTREAFLRNLSRVAPTPATSDPSE